MAHKLSRSVAIKSILCLLALSWLSIQSPSSIKSAQAPPRSTTLRIAINVSDAALPVSIGVPVAESSNIFSTDQLGVIEGGGKPVASSIRVLSRWRGVAADASKPVKWMLVDFKPDTAGIHYLTRAQRPELKPVVISVSGAGLQVKNSLLEIDLPGRGEALVRSFKLGGKEVLSAPFSIRSKLPKRAMIAKLGASIGAGADTIVVTDASLFKPGNAVKFERVDALKWDASSGSSRLVTFDQGLPANRRYRIGEGGSTEEVEVNTALPGDLKSSSPLKFDHPAGSPIRDLTVERESATIKSISGQIVQFMAPLKIQHSPGEKVYVQNAVDLISTATVERTITEESNPLRAVIRQEGYFKSDLGKTPSMISFALRYYIYADQPFIRVRLRLMNDGPYGFGSSRTYQPPFTQHAILRELSATLPTADASRGGLRILTAKEAHERIDNRQTSASLSAGSFEFAVPEFVENYPKALSGGKEMKFDILPETGADYIFDGSRAKTTDMILGRNAVAARSMTNSLNGRLDPAYVATTGAVRPSFTVKRNFAAEAAKDPQLAEAAVRVEKMLEAGYAVESTEAAGAVPQTSIFEYRERSVNGEQFGWRNFGDLAWAEGYANVHYDLPFILLREYLRTGDPRAFQLGGEMARYRADWGHYRTDDYIDREKVWNLRGLAFYEKGDHGSFLEPVPTHTWIEGLWLYWALTGDEAVRETAVDASNAFARMNLTFDNALGWNEPRMVGWPILGLVTAYRYTGEPKYFNKARANINLIIQTEERFGRKGHYISRGANMIEAAQPWAWSYSLLGVIEFWRDTNDKRTADFLLRVADWLIGKNGKNPPIKPAKTAEDGTYLPNGVSYFWTPDKIAEDRSVALAGLSLPVLSAAAKISNRADLKARAREIFIDYAFYRDLPGAQSIDRAARGVINFRSLQFGATATKVYGQMGLTIPEHLPDLTFAGKPAQSTTVAAAATQTRQTSKAPAPSSPASPEISGAEELVDVALERPAMASSQTVWPNAIGSASAANDGKMSALGKASIWHSAVNSGRIEWWQVDLGKSYPIHSVEIIFRDDQDQPSTRRNFEVLGSDDLKFEESELLASRGEEPVPFRQYWKIKIGDRGAYRYIRVRKTRIDPDAYAQSFFTLAEVRVYTQADNRSTAAAPPANLYTPVKSLLTDELTSQKLLLGQTLDFAVATKDEEGQSLRLHAYNIPRNSRFDASKGEFTFTPDLTQAGEVFQVGLRAVNSTIDRTQKMDVAVEVEGSPRVTLLAPDAKSKIVVNRPVIISWSSPDRLRVIKHQIRLSTDGGATYPTILAELPGSQTRFLWKASANFPILDKAAVRFMIKAFDSKNRVGLDFTKKDITVSANNQLK